MYWVLGVIGAGVGTWAFGCSLRALRATLEVVVRGRAKGFDYYGMVIFFKNGLQLDDPRGYF